MSAITIIVIALLSIIIVGLIIGLLLKGRSGCNADSSICGTYCSQNCATYCTCPTGPTGTNCPSCPTGTTGCNCPVCPTGTTGCNCPTGSNLLPMNIYLYNGNYDGALSLSLLSNGLVAQTDGNGNPSTTGTSVQFIPNSNSGNTSAMWYIIPTGSNQFYLQNAASGLYLNMDPSSLAISMGSAANTPFTIQLSGSTNINYLIYYASSCDSDGAYLTYSEDPNSDAVGTCVNNNQGDIQYMFITPATFSIVS